MRPSTASLGALLVAGAILTSAPVAAGAQEPAAPRRATGALIGFVTDSISGSTLGGATIQVARQDDPTVAFSATTDATGAFRIDSVPVGVYLAGFFHPRLDSLGIDAPTYRVTVAEGDTPLVLAIPGPTTVAVASCGLAPADSSGLIFGRVSAADAGEPLVGATVTVSWLEVVMDQRGVRQERRELAATTAESGRFALCGIPTDVPVVARAELGSDATGMIELQVPPRSLVHQEFLVPRGDAAAPVAVAGVATPADAADAADVVRRGTARLAGTVRHADGRPFGNARVVVHGTLASDTTGADGRFQLDALPAGTHTLEVRAIGFTPQRVAVNLASGRTDTATVTVAERVAALDAVTVYGKAPQSRHRLSQFLERQQRGFGHFITAQDIERRAAFETADLLRTVPGLLVVPSGGFGSRVVMRGVNLQSGTCSPTVFLDGMRLAGDNGDLGIIQPNQIAGIEVYTRASSAPPEYQGGPCGTIVIWSKGALR